MADISVLIAHKHEKANDAALKVALDTIVDNTVHDYELLIDSTTPANVYQVYNQLAVRASAPYIVFTNSDVFFAPRWDIPMLVAADPDAIVTGVIVECGAIGVATANVHRDFGMRPQTFRRKEFEEWVEKEQPLPPGDGWYFPSLHNRQAFLDMGGFDLTKGTFPTEPLDILYWNTWRERGGIIKHVRSYCYHLQHYCAAEEQTKTVRFRCQEQPQSG